MATQSGPRSGALLMNRVLVSVVARMAAITDPAALAPLTLFCSDPAALHREVHPLLTAMAEAIDTVGLALAATCVPVQVAFGEADDGWRLTDRRDMARRLGAPVQVITDALRSPAVEQPAATVKILTEFWGTPAVVARLTLARVASPGVIMVAGVESVTGARAT